MLLVLGCGIGPLKLRGRRAQRAGDLGATQVRVCVANPRRTPHQGYVVARLVNIALALLLAPTLVACAGQQILNTFSPSSGYTLTADVPYGQDPRQRMDIYQPVDATNAPVVVFFYGGRWSDGDKALYRFIGEAFSSLGYLTVVPDYRLYPQVKFPAFVDDGAQAVMAARELARRYGGNPDKLFVMGHSAGAHICAMLATDSSYMNKFGGQRSMISGFIGMAGPYDFLPIYAHDLADMFGPPSRYEQSQPINYVDDQLPPMLLLHGENDTTVYVKNSRNLANAASKAGAPDVTLKTYSSLSHARIIAVLSSPLRGLATVYPDIQDWIDARAE